MLDEIISRFSVPGALIKAERFGSGLINDTWLCEFEDRGAARKYILQHINKSVFKQPELVMKNVEIVTGHIQERLRREGVAGPENVTPALIRTRDGASYHIDGSGEYWRMFHFIESGEVFDRVTGSEHAYEVGRGLGRFQSLVSDLPPGGLSDTLPGFHHTPVCLKQFDEAVTADAKGRAAEAKAEMDFVNARRALAPVLMEAMESGGVPIRVVHNDPKVNNVLIHKETREALCMVDLDTVKSGIVHFDFGDCVRSAANRAGEDAENLDEVRLDVSLYQEITRGYLREAGSFLTPKEVELLPVSVKVITFELGLRFLADYLRGDVYFKIKYPGHNIHRARVQFRLLKSVEDAGLQAMKAYLTQTH
jgi:Ser/Thr protein kinase RdoA (MazF antagonist)